MKQSILILIIFLFAISCTERPIDIPTDTDGNTAWTGLPQLDDLVIYEVNLRAFSQEGTIQGLIVRLDSIKALGVNIIWLMPIHPVGVLKGINSPYCIKDFSAVGNEYGNMSDMKSLVDSAHAKGMGVIMDWVANHTSWDHPWTKISGFYTVNQSGSIVHPPGTTWTDVADLNFDNRIMRDSMIASMKLWVKEYDIDGFRCDYADGVPADFWRDAIIKLDSVKSSLLFLAEGTRGDHFSSGFDLIFSWNYYSTLKSVYAGGSAMNITSTHATEYNSVPKGKHRLRFTTNHDESAWDNSPVQIFKGIQGALSASAITIFLEGVPLLYSGQEVGRASKTPFFSKSPINWNENPFMLKAYADMMNVYTRNDVARRGENTLFQYRDAVCFKKTYQGKEMLIMANVRNQQTQISLPLALQNTYWKDALSNVNDTLNSTVTLSPYQYRILIH